MSDLEKKEADILKPSEMELDKRDSCLYEKNKYENYRNKVVGMC
jgi:hypothetical protein